VKVKENIKRFFRKDLTSFFTLLPTFDLLLVYSYILSVCLKIDLNLLKIWCKSCILP